MTDLYTQQRNDLAAKFKRLPGGALDYARADAVLAENAIFPNTRQEAQKPASSIARAQTRPTPERTGTADSVTITIPGNYITTNHMYINIPDKKTGIGIRVPSNDSKKWKARAVQIVQPYAKLLQPAFTYLLELRVYNDFLTLDGRVKKRDLDNAVKLAQDALGVGLGFDDAKFWQIKLEKHHDLKNPRIEAIITVLEPLKQTTLFGSES